MQIIRCFTFPLFNFYKDYRYFLCIDPLVKSFDLLPLVSFPHFWNKLPVHFGQNKTFLILMSTELHAHVLHLIYWKYWKTR